MFWNGLRQCSPPPLLSFQYYETGSQDFRKKNQKFEKWKCDFCSNQSMFPRMWFKGILGTLILIILGLIVFYQRKYETGFNLNLKVKALDIGKGVLLKWNFSKFSMHFWHENDSHFKNTQRCAEPSLAWERILHFKDISWLNFKRIFIM